MATRRGSSSIPQSPEESALDAAILLDIINGITPPVESAVIECLKRVFVERQISLTLMKELSSSDLKAEPFLINDPVDRARVLSGSSVQSVDLHQWCSWAGRSLCVRKLASHALAR